MVTEFLVEYPTLISAQAFELGEMFNRDEYPDVEQVARRFGFRATYSPVAEIGDWRVDIGEEAKRALEQQYADEYNRRLEGVLSDVRERIGTSLKHLSERFTNDTNGERKRFNNDILDKFIDSLSTVRALNLTNDPQIAKILNESEWAVANVDIEEIKHNENIRDDVRNRVNSILDSFDF
jgi:hypothetical protein